MPTLETVPTSDKKPKTSSAKKPSSSKKGSAKKSKASKNEATDGKKQPTLASFFTPRKPAATTKKPSASTTKKNATVTPRHDKKQLFDIVMGTTTTAAAAATTSRPTEIAATTTTATTTADDLLPIRGIRHSQFKSRVTPSPIPAQQPEENKKSPQEKVNLLEKLERSVEKPDDSSNDEVAEVVLQKKNASTEADLSSTEESQAEEKEKQDSDRQDESTQELTAKDKNAEIPTSNMISGDANQDSSEDDVEESPLESTEDVEMQEPTNDAPEPMDEDSDDETVTFESPANEPSAEQNTETPPSNTISERTELKDVEMNDAPEPSENNAEENDNGVMDTFASEEDDPDETPVSESVVPETENKGESETERQDESKENQPCTHAVDEVVVVDQEPLENPPDTQPKETAGEVEIVKEHSTTTEGTKLAPDVAERMKKHENMRSRYIHRAHELVEKAKEGLAEEGFTLPTPAAVELEASNEEEFPSDAIASLALVIQESSLPLAKLAERAMEVLKKTCTGATFATDAVAAKIKVLASRESYIAHSNAKTDVFEDDNADRMWRWELVSVELLPSVCISKVKKARTARRKLRTHHKAISKLLLSLDEADRLLLDPGSKKEKLKTVLARISTEEEKVLKYEREAEKQRLALEAKKQKEQAKARLQLEKEKEKAQKQLEKQQAEQSRREEKAEKERKKQEEKAEKERKKQEAAELKRKQKEEKESERKRERLAKEAKAKKTEEKTQKQRAMMQSFFTAPSQATPAKKKATEKKVAQSHNNAGSSFDTEHFRSLIDSRDRHLDAPVFAKLSDRARASRTRKTKKVSVTVFVTVLSDNPFGEQPYDEQREINVPNKYKFFRFHEDYRPPYHGTWSKPRSSAVTGRTPFGKETEFLNYDEDSEAEWEEGDDDPGEDCESDAGDDEEDNMDDEEGDTRVYNYQDGWLAHDDDLGGEEVDLETMALRKKKLEERNDKTVTELSTVCVIAPAMGGLPLSKDQITDEDAKEFVEGVCPTEAMELLASHEGQVCAPNLELCWDAFPPHLVDECTPSSSDPSCVKDGSTKVSATGKGTTNSQEMSKEDLRIFAQFVHNCTLPSKDKIVEQLRTLHQEIIPSRAHATRKLDAIAEKKRIPSGGVIWKVKKSVLEELGLEELLKVDVPPVKPAKQTKVSSSASNAEPETPPTGSPKEAASRTSSKKRKDAPSAGAKMFAAFLKKKKTGNTSKK